METITNKVIDTLEGVKDTLEKKDEDLQKRQNYFASRDAGQ